VRRVSFQYSLVQVPEGWDPEAPVPSRSGTIYAQLRDLAKEATQDEPYRVAEYAFHTQDDLTAKLSQVVRNRPEGLSMFIVLSTENQVVATSLNGPTSAANAMFFAACTPSTILKLLDNLDAAETRVEDLTQELQNLRAELEGNK